MLIGLLISLLIDHCQGAASARDFHVRLVGLLWAAMEWGALGRFTGRGAATCKCSSLRVSTKTHL